ncbi:alpha/beta fold hydrolase [Lutimonas zeaxanthinifaciens]|uniref:alpha/beta fold hydrolase n=1 Tax=Lutimonas zeaxanthinifaciens TaxID=3060215 RepID=UPI00265CB28E|nr:alpha/beta hydrolase [Lutimonas sp. YSD2104]WKK66352.1 alpha/beta hydrolase [Lutimonas sp. YSD2104]
MIYKSVGTQPGTIFCIHGNSSSSRVFKDFLESNLIPQSKIVVDLPGHGDNNKGHFEQNDFTFDALKKYLVKLLENIDDDILLIGNSLGGHLAIEIAPEIEHLKGLVIMGTPPVKKPLNFEEAFISIPELNSFFKEDYTDEELDAFTGIALVNSSAKDVLSEDFKKCNPTVRSTLASDIMNGSFDDQYKIYTNLPFPKYIIAGDKDPSVKREYLNQVNELSKYGSKLIEIDNCGHYPSVDCPEKFIETIRIISQRIFK